MKKKIYEKPSIKEHKLQHHAYLLDVSNPGVDEELIDPDEGGEVDEAW